MAFIEKNENGLVILQSDIIPLKHAFTTRFGGVSKGDFATLNLGSNRGDDFDAVRENYRRVCAFMGADIDGCAVTKQVHGNEVRVVSAPDKHVCFSETPYEADGIVSVEKGMPLFCFTADCIPALLCDPENGVAAAVHCGWRSSVADILGVAVGKMETLGAKRENIRCAMGPSIGPCCFETDRDVPDAIDAYIGPGSGCYVRRPDGKYMTDLKMANVIRLKQLGLSPEHIDVSDECTRCKHEKYWSHRYTSANRLQRGSLAAVIVL